MARPRCSMKDPNSLSSMTALMSSLSKETRACIMNVCSFPARIWIVPGHASRSSRGDRRRGEECHSPRCGTAEAPHDPLPLYSAGGEPRDEIPLEDEENEDDRDRGHDGSRNEHIIVVPVRRQQGGQPDRDCEHVSGTHDDKRPEEIIPALESAEDGHGAESRRHQRRHDAKINAALR